MVVFVCLGESGSGKGCRVPCRFDTGTRVWDGDLDVTCPIHVNAVWIREGGA